MGKGDKKTKKGKITIGSYGKKRRKKEKISAIKPKKVEAKAKPERPADEVAAKPKVEVKPKVAAKPKAEVKEKVADKPKAESKEKASPKKTETKAKPKKEE